MWRKCEPRREHKERSQPVSRQHLGLLEKKKDYKLRSLDYHKKQSTITTLKKKATLKNPDEFYHAMITKTKKSNPRNQVFDHETQLLLKSQDQGYIQMHVQMNEKKIEKLKKSIHIVPTTGEHTIFVRDQEEAAQFDPVTHFDTVPELMDNPWNRLKKSQLETMELEQVVKDDKRIKALNKRLEQAEKLKKISGELNIQKQLMKKGARKKVGVDDKGLPVYKWLPRRSK